MFNSLRKIFCLHVYEYSWDHKHGYVQECRKCGKNDQLHLIPNELLCHLKSEKIQMMSFYAEQVWFIGMTCTKAKIGSVELREQ